MSFPPIPNSPSSEPEPKANGCSAQLETRVRNRPDVQTIVYIDGSSLSNPGPAGVGICITNSHGTIIKELSHCIGLATCNQAEYSAMLLALEELIRLGASSTEIRTDSQLLFSQLTGRYRVRNSQLRDLHKKALTLLSHLPEARIVLIPREENSTADRLARAASSAAARMLRNAKQR